jgi:GGDEF domain-containing protein
LDREELDGELPATKQNLDSTRKLVSRMQGALKQAKEVAEEAKQRALRDGMTGIPNRELFSGRLEQAVALVKRYGWMLAVMFIDLDGFKQINDIYGHDVGDKVLQLVAQRLDERPGGGYCLPLWWG